MKSLSIMSIKIKIHMKLILAFLLTGLHLAAWGQYKNFDAADILPSYNLEIAANKTTLLIFPSEIKAADRGGKYVLAEKMTGAVNVLKVKAGEKNFPASSLHVVTADGKVYAFVIRYSDAPPYQTIHLGNLAPGAAIEFEGESLNEEQLTGCAQTISEAAPFLRGPKARAYGMEFRLEGVFLCKDVLFFSFRLKNHSALPYEIAAIRFSVRDKKTGRHMAIESKELQAEKVFYYGQVKSADGMRIVTALPKFSIAGKKRLVISLAEKDGDRYLSLKVNHNKLLEVRRISQSELANH